MKTYIKLLNILLIIVIIAFGLFIIRYYYFLKFVPKLNYDLHVSQLYLLGNKNEGKSIETFGYLIEEKGDDATYFSRYTGTYMNAPFRSSLISWFR